MNKYLIAFEAGVMTITTMDKIYKTIKNCEFMQDVCNNIKIYQHHKNNKVVRTVEEKTIDNKILNSIKKFYKVLMGKKYNKDFDKYINKIPKNIKTVENYETYKLLIDKLGIKQKLLNDITYNLTNRELLMLIYEYNLITNNHLVYLLNKCNK